VKEGAEEVGDKTEDVFDDETYRDDDDDDKATSSERMKPGAAQENKSTTTSETKASETTTTTESSEESERDEGELPATAGGLTLLALTGAMALFGAGASRVLRRK
jgi:hypothetical protein